MTRTRKVSGTPAAPPPPPSGNAAASLPLALGVTALALLTGYLIKRQCAVNPWVNNFQYTRFCYNEIQALFGVRGIAQGLIPYVDTRFEYPVLTGMFMDAAGRLLRALVRLGIMASNDSAGYLAVSSLLLAPFAFAVTVLLRPRVTRTRLLVWAMGVPLVLYAFHNWDLLAVSAAVWGLVSLQKSRTATAGAALAAGASAKLFPVFLMPGVVLARWAQGDRSGARRAMLAFGVTYAAINIPWILASGGPGRIPTPALTGVDLRRTGTNGWLEVWRFHADRYPDYWTVWYWIAKYGRKLNPGSWWEAGFPGYRNFVNLAGLVLFAVGSLWLLWLGWRRRPPHAVDGIPDPEGGYPATAVGMGIIALFLLTSKVYSPQYALWMAPFLVMLDIPWRAVLAYLAAEVAVLVSGFYWFTVIDQPAPAWKGALEAAVWVRALTLVVLIACSLRARRLVPGQVAGNISSRSPMVSSRPRRFCRCRPIH